MTRNFFNWTAENVVRFIKKYNFTQTHAKGSHVFYFGHYGGIPRQVCIPFHGARILKPRTLKGIIRQSGIPKEKWVEWR